MARPAHITFETLIPLIRARGPISATELGGLARVNRTTIVRILPDFGDELVTLGATRSTRYLLRRRIRNIGNRWRIYRIDASGRAEQWAELEAMHERQWRMNWASAPPEWAGFFTEKNGLWSGFPFFLGDARPQGFLGRLISHGISRTLQLPDDPRQWSDDDVIVYQQAIGEDLPGNLVVGDEMVRRALARSADLPDGKAVAWQNRKAFYAARASGFAEVMPGSSAGGEQPKFLATLRDDAGGFQPVLVKFSARMDEPVGRRWADLLVCEFHAHQVLAEWGLANPGVRLLDADGRRFLEVPRFDRCGPGGRVGVVSLEALAAALIGNLSRDWLDATTELHRHGLIDSGSLEKIRRLQAFGELIGNTDMHFGNLAFFLSDTLPLQVTPAYDMLPMLWSPGNQGELTPRRFSPAPPLPALAESWREAAGWAEIFWQRVVRDERISGEFGRMAQEAGEVVGTLLRRV
ncbi:type II toxin-antitoxin system HipA family toxin YjjJ [Luteolibacter yonseiensis]|uniref:Type II toxin-antitoxin system HipA family toxin YjjJ n=1 Tax=Luteolibacter yonseiensis TaxID=1144680 RepID=A0A934R4Y4_9BACT|nr:type II toxin-antitoxin system HipA family toxin YjjJ [Luteolibacter yonseiensis]MBK1816452.1 type II toxin-antitoxin system HipA family toxin YjjJ [Luteolibacter yonseiensis]